MTTAESGSDEFKIRDAESYDSVADQFERFTARFSLPLVTRLISEAGLDSSQQVLDIGTGTGIVALQAAQKVRPPGSVLGVDLSEGMLAQAGARAALAGLARWVEFRKMDAEALEIEDHTFDVVLSLFALLHFPDPRKAIGQMFRVLRPGGVITIGIGSGPPLLSLAGLTHRASSLWQLLDQIRGKRLTAPFFINEMVDRCLPEPQEREIALWSTKNPTRTLPRLVREAGFSNLRITWEGHQVMVKTPEEFWELQATFSSKARKRLASAAPEKVARVQDEFLQICRKTVAGGGKLVYPYAALFVTARKP